MHVKVSSIIVNFINVGSLKLMLHVLDNRKREDNSRSSSSVHCHHFDYMCQKKACLIVKDDGKNTKQAN